MPYGAIKVDNITFTNNGADQVTTVSGFYRAITSGITVTGTISGVTLQGTTISGTTVTGTTANFTSGVFTTLSGASTTVTSGIFASGSAAAPSLSIISDANTGLYSPGADQVALATAGTGRLFVDASGQVGIGTASPSAALDVQGGGVKILNQGSTSYLEIGQGTSTSQAAFIDLITDTTYTDFGLRLIRDGAGANAVSQLAQRGTGDLSMRCLEAAPLTFYTTNTERFRIDSSGRLLVGASTARANLYNSPATAQHQSEIANSTAIEYLGIRNSTDLFGGTIALVKSRGTTVGSNTIVQSGDQCGVVSFQGSDGTEFVESAKIECQVDGTPGINDMPGRLVFSTTADGAASPTERMSITSAGFVGIGTTSPNQPLHVVGNARFTASLLWAGTGATNSYLDGTATGLLKIGSNDRDRIKINATEITFNDASSEFARIDSSGRLLVGTSSAAQLNDFSGDIPVQISRGGLNCGIQLGSFRNDAFGADILFAKSRSSALGTNTLVNQNDGLGAANWYGADGIGYIKAARIECFVDGIPGTNDMPGRLVFSTTADGAASPTERMRINSNGSFGLINVSGTDTLYVSNGTTAGTAQLLISGRHTASSVYGGTESFRVSTNGDVQNTNNSYGAISDAKLKENIVDATSQWSDIKALQVRKYNFKEQTGQETHTQIGLVAQEVELVSPGLVEESIDRDQDGNDLGTVTKSVNYSVLYMKAVKALQEVMERIEALEARLAAAGIE